MSPEAGVNLRRLLHQARDIAESPNRSAKNSRHPIGLGVKTGRSYLANSETFPLPTRDPALQRFVDEVAQPVKSLDRDFSLLAWRHLFDDPQFVIEVTPPTQEECLRQKVVAQVEVDQLRRILVGVALRHPGEALQGGVMTSPRIAGLAAITFEFRPKSKFVENAWVSTSWHESTHSLSQAIEAFVPRSRKQANAESALLTLNDSEVTLASGDEAAIVRAAAAAGLDLTVRRVGADNQRDVAGALLAQPPTWLFLVGPTERMRQAASDYNEANHTHNPPALISFTTAPGLMADLRDRFLSAASVDAALRPLDLPQAPSDVEDSDLPFVPTQCLHHKSTKYRYVLDPATGLYWTKDAYEHGGSKYKQYRKHQQLLRHVADLDETQTIMTGKTKGKQGETMPLTAFDGCAYPRSHF